LLKLFKFEAMEPITKASRTEWIGLAVLALPTLLVSMDATVTYLAIPTISAILKPSASELLWITDIYIFLEGGLLITMGTLGDRIGRKKLLIYGAVAFAIASAFAAFANSAHMLIAARGLMGIAGATLLPSTVSLIRSMFHDDRQRAVAIGIWTTCFSTGTMLGPLLGGLLLHYFWWGSVFLISVPVMLLFLVMGPLFLREYRSPGHEKFDLVSAFQLLAGILAIIYSIKRIGERLVAEPITISLLVAGAVILYFFIKRQRRITNPLIDLNLFLLAPFSATLLALLCSLFCWSGVYLFVAQYLQLVLMFDAQKAGLWTVPAAALGMISCLSAPLIARFAGRNTVIITGMILIMMGLIMLSQVPDNAGLFLLVFATILLTAGCSLAVTLGVDKVISSVPASRAGVAAGIYETSTTFGSALGIAVLGSIGTAIYRNSLHSEQAGNTLGQASTLSASLPANQAKDLFQLAQTSFNYAFAIIALFAVVMLFIVILVVGSVYRSERSISPNADYVE